MTIFMFLLIAAAVFSHLAILFVISIMLSEIEIAIRRKL